MNWIELNWMFSSTFHITLRKFGLLFGQCVQCTQYSTACVHTIQYKTNLLTFVLKINYLFNDVVWRLIFCFNVLVGGGGMAQYLLLSLAIVFLKYGIIYQKKPCDGTILSHREYSSTLRTVRKVLAEFAESIWLMKLYVTKS